MTRRKFSTFKFVGVFAATALIFLVGILLGNYLTSLKVTEVNSMQDDLRMGALALEVQSLILNKNPCATAQLNVISEELYKIGSKLTFMESQLSANNNEVVRLKNYYSILELRHWALFNEAKQKCDIASPLILYFYSNEVNCPNCQGQGYVLDYIHKIKPEVKIYSLEYTLENSAINTVKELYKIDANKLPVLVINDLMFEGFKDRDELEEILNEL